MICRCIFVIGVMLLFVSSGVLSGCRKQHASEDTAKPALQATETRTAVGWVMNPHTEVLHTVVGFKTTDGLLLNLIFPGMHQQLADGMYCRVTYHRATDDSLLPDVLRQYTRKASVDYFILDKVELLPKPGKNSPKSHKGGK